MSVNTNWIIQKMENWAPSGTAEAWDNVGLLIGDAHGAVNRVLVALDATETVIREAVEGRFDFIITHHPFIFNPINRITNENLLGRKIMTLIQNGIGLYSAHTNLDMADGGVNDILFDRLDIIEKEGLLLQESECSLGRVGLLREPTTLAQLASRIAEQLSLNNIRYTGEDQTLIRKVGLCAGDAAGERYMRTAKQKGCDVYITGDLRYHGAQEALDEGLCLIDITHYGGEAPVVEAIAAYINQEAARDGVMLTVCPTTQDGQVFKTVRI